MPLDEYRKKRSFKNTPEPVGGKDSNGTYQSPAPESGELRFAIQKHDASRLHYDLRLELDGVLLSWAVPKGPSLDPTEKRLAIHVEDHPIEYGDFEGVIPAGEYGGGTVLLWDVGTWQPLEPDGYARGELKFELNGHRLQGRWMLVHTGRRGRDPKHWLLFKERDGLARKLDEYDVLTEQTTSVLSGRTLAEIESDRDAIWTSKDTACSKQEMKKQVSAAVDSTTTTESVDLGSVKGARSRKMPATMPRPMLPAASREAPKGEDWLHEIKYDGYRMLCCVRDGEARFISRNGNDWTNKVPRLAKRIANLPVVDAIFDGEVVAMAADGTTDFQALQNTIGRGQDAALRYYLFDLLYLNGYDLTGVGLAQRKQLLEPLLPSADNDSLHYSEHIQGNGPTVFQHACRLGTEGIVSKRAGRKYVSGRTMDWLKTKSLVSAEFVVGGFTESTTSRYGFGSLVLGAYDGSDLVYLGRVGTGFTDLSRETLSKVLVGCKSGDNPFVNLEARMIERRVYWVEPIHVAEVEFGGWTVDTVLRFPSFRGMRPDIEPGQVTVENVTSQQPSALAGEPDSPQTAATSIDELTDSKAFDGSNETPIDEVETGGFTGVDEELSNVAEKGIDGNERSSSPSALSPDLIGNIDRLNLTNPNRVMYPASGVTKLAIAEHYIQVAHLMLPHLLNRPLALVRCPKGISQRCFFQKSRAKGMPDSVDCERVSLDGEQEQDAIYVQDLAGLISLVQFSALEFHVWGCRIDRPDRPDRLIIDLDPDESIPFVRICQAAFEIREVFEALGLVSFVKTTGGKGLHVVVPIRRTIKWHDLHEFAGNLCGKIEGTSPGRYTTSASKRARGGKIYLDFLRNGFGATSIAAYSTRSRPGASVSTPIEWSELETLRNADSYSVGNIQRRLANQTADPWAQMEDVRQSITKSMMKSVSVKA